MLSLTPEQAAIVAHDHGPALVYAVAGAGKTTAMEYRAARLVDQGIFAPRRILATTFNRRAADELAARICRHPGCDHVRVMTLHALGYRILREGVAQGLLRDLGSRSFTHIQENDRTILRHTLARAFAEKVAFVRELDTLDQADFLDYVGACKGRLAYADLAAANLAPDAAKIARQAEPPAHNRWYLDLYRLYETVRQASGLLTFDDLLLRGWEALATRPHLRRHFQGAFDALLVDEFQDVNLAQVELLDLLAAPHGNYMAIGDDDQTIYTWRGADPRFIRTFEKRYNAARYTMLDNFRCPAGPVALANAVIRRKKQGLRKQMRLTQGFHGATAIRRCADEEEMAQALVEMVRRSRRDGLALRDMAVLVRLYAQTGSLEQALMEAGIPYVVEGAEPFYRRGEVQTLVAYCRLAYLDDAIRQGQELSPAQAEQWRADWRLIYHQPNRYLAKQVAGEIADHVCFGGTTLVAALRGAAKQARARQAELLETFAETMSWLRRAMAKRAPALQTLLTLEEALDYGSFLEEKSEFSGAERAETVAAFIRFARGKGDIVAFLQHVRALDRAADTEIPADHLTILSLHRAKGREWPAVFIPGCNGEVIPHRRGDPEEERRLFYVGITRARRDLTLFWAADAPMSPFLRQVAGDKILGSLAQIQDLLGTPPDAWPDGASATLVRAVAALGAGDYFSGWWRAAPAEQAAILAPVVRFLRRVQERNAWQDVGIRPEEGAGWLALAGDDR